MTLPQTPLTRRVGRQAAEAALRDSDEIARLVSQRKRLSDELRLPETARSPRRLVTIRDQILTVQEQENRLRAALAAPRPLPEAPATPPPPTVPLEPTGRPPGRLPGGPAGLPAIPELAQRLPAPAAGRAERRGQLQELTTLPFVEVEPEVLEFIRQFEDVVQRRFPEELEQLPGPGFTQLDQFPPEVRQSLVAIHSLKQQKDEDPEAFLQMLYEMRRETLTGTLETAERREDAIILLMATFEIPREEAIAFFRPDTRRTLTLLFPEYTTSEITGIAMAQRDVFHELLRQKGQNWATLTLLHAWGYSAAEINEVLDTRKKFLDVEGVTRLVTVLDNFMVLDEQGQEIGRVDPDTAEFIPYQYRIGDTWDSFTAGVGDVIATSGGALRWLGVDGIGQNLSEFGEFMQAQGPPDTLGEFSWQHLFNPRWWATTPIRTSAFTLSLVPAMIVGGAAGAEIAAIAGVTGFGRLVLQALGAATMARPIESALEAGGAYDAALDSGMAVTEARVIADDVYKKNLSLAGLDFFEYATAFAPVQGRVFKNLVTRGLVRTAEIGGRVAVVGLTEAGEEFYQEVIQRQALGEDIVWDAEMKEVVALGAIMGAGFGGGAQVYQSIKTRTIGAFTEEMAATFEEMKRLILEEKGEIGKPSEEDEAKAEDEALNRVADEEEGVEEIVEAVVEQVNIDELVKEVQPKTEEEAIAWEKNVEKMRLEAAQVPGQEVAAVPPPPPEPPDLFEEVGPAPDSGSAATQRVLDHISFGPEQEGFRDKFTRGLHTFQVTMVDDIISIRQLRQAVEEGGLELSLEEDFEMQARLLNGMNSKATVFLEDGTFGKTYWKVNEDGKTVPNFTGESLQSILQDVKEPAAWQDFSAYLVSRRDIQLSERGIETGINEGDAQLSMDELELRYPNFPDLAVRIDKFQDDLLVYIHEMELISDDLLTTLRNNTAYVPFYRVMDEAQRQGMLGKKMANIANPIKRIKGSEREIINPLESIVKNVYAFVNAAERNQVGIMLANLVDKSPQVSAVFERVPTPMVPVAKVSAKELGVDIAGLSAEDAEKVVDIFRPTFQPTEDLVTVLVNGEKHFYRVDPDLRDALMNSAVGPEQLGWLGTLLSRPAQWLRAGAVLSPDFMFRNPVRDQFQAFAYSKYGYVPLDFMAAIGDIFGNSEAMQLYRMSGAENSMLVSMDREYLQKSFEEIVEGKNFTDYVKHPLEVLQIMSELTEKGTRLGEFKKGLDAGATPIEAGASSREVSQDFMIQGTIARVLNRFIPFFTATVGGHTRLIRAFKENPIRTSVKMFMGITVPSILLYLVNRDEDWYKETPQWQKDLFWLFKVDDPIPNALAGLPGAFLVEDGVIFRIPKPFVPGILFGSMPERLLEFLDEGDPQILLDVLKQGFEGGSPGWIPQVALPIIENLSNHSFFLERDIVPQSRQQLPPELQYTRYTSDVSKKLGELLGRSPADIDNLIRGWTGGLGRYVTDILDLVLRKTGVSPDIPRPSPTLADIPVIKAFVVRNPYGSSGETVNRFYDLLEEYTEGEKFLKEMLKLGEQEKFAEFKAGHPELLFFADSLNDTEYSATARYLRRVARDLSEISKKQDLIFNDRDMSPEEKREKIDELDELKTEVARRAMDLFPGDQPRVLEERLSEAEDRLGEVLSETPELSRDAPDIYNMRKLGADYANILEAVPSEEIVSKEGVSPIVQSWFDMKDADLEQSGQVNVPLYRINADPNKGDTFEDFYNQGQRLGELPEEDRAEWLKLHPKAFLGNLTKRQLDTLRKFHAGDAATQEQMLEDEVIGGTLKFNPREEFLRRSPKENALLALWGQGKILTKEAHDEFLRLVEDLDIPDSALPDLVLPPPEAAEAHFEYLEAEPGRDRYVIRHDNPELEKWLIREHGMAPVGDRWMSPEQREQKRFMEREFETEETIGEEAVRSPSGTPPVALQEAHQAYATAPRGRARLIVRHENPEYEKWLVEEQGFAPVGDRWMTPEQRAAAPEEGSSLVPANGDIGTSTGAPTAELAGLTRPPEGAVGREPPRPPIENGIAEILREGRKAPLPEPIPFSKSGFSRTQEELSQRKEAAGDVQKGLDAIRAVDSSRLTQARLGKLPPVDVGTEQWMAFIGGLNQVVDNIQGNRAVNTQAVIRQLNELIFRSDDPNVQSNVDVLIQTRDFLQEHGVEAGGLLEFMPLQSPSAPPAGPSEELSNVPARVVSLFRKRGLEVPSPRLIRVWAEEFLAASDEKMILEDRAFFDVLVEMGVRDSRGNLLDIEEAMRHESAERAIRRQFDMDEATEVHDLVDTIFPGMFIHPELDTHAIIQVAFKRHMIAGLDYDISVIDEQLRGATASERQSLLKRKRELESRRSELESEIPKTLPRMPDIDSLPSAPLSRARTGHVGPPTNRNAATVAA